MRSRFDYLFPCLLLAACASDDPRYRDTTALEKPPTLAVERQAVADQPESAAADKLPEDAAPAADEDQGEAEPKTKKGLGEQVISLSDSPPLVLTIRQSFDVAWNSLKQGLIQSGIEVTDLEHDKGKFYVSYDADSYVSQHGSLIEKSVGLFTNDYVKQTYELTVSAEDSVTKVTAASISSKAGESLQRADHDDEEGVVESPDDTDKPSDGADKLLRSVYLTLKDELHEN
jgi:hypothetical protein